MIILYENPELKCFERKHKLTKKTLHFQTFDSLYLTIQHMKSDLQIIQSELQYNHMVYIFFTNF
jgi:hypothetical protein